MLTVRRDKVVCENAASLVRCPRLFYRLCFFSLLIKRLGNFTFAFEVLDLLIEKTADWSSSLTTA